MRGAYEIDPDAPAAASRSRSRTARSPARALEPVGIKVVADGALFAAAGIPTVYHGPVGSGAHADVEYMPVDELVRAAEVYVALLQAAR